MIRGPAAQLTSMQSNPRAGPSRNAYVQVLRAVAAASVVLFHLVPLTTLATSYPAILTLSQFGLFGVDLFFVISGFVVTRCALPIDSISSAFSFLVRRFVRIYCGYYLALLPLAVLLAAGVPPLTAEANIVGSLMLIEWRLERNILPVAWSLTFELWFYVCLAVCFACFRQWRSRAFAIGGLVAFLGFWHGGWALFSHDLWMSDRLPFPFLLSGLAIEFLLGAALAMISDRYHPDRSWALVAGLMVAVGVVGVSRLDTAHFAISSVRAMTGGIAATGLVLLCVVANAAGQRDGSRLRVRPPMPLVLLGNASYALYLLHPVILAAIGWWGSRGVDLMRSAYSAYEAGALLLACLLASVFWWWYVEAPLTRLVGRSTP